MQTLIAPKSVAEKPEFARFALDRNRTGLIVGMVLGLWHFAWSALVWLGFAQKLLDLVLWLHFLGVPVQVQAFSLGRALGLVAFTFATGYVLGWIFAFVWEAYHPSPRI